jgi:hypothetical protein
MGGVQAEELFYQMKITAEQTFFQKDRLTLDLIHELEF